MNFEDLKLAWNSQSDEPDLVINQQALLTTIERQNAFIGRQINTLEWTNIIVGFAMPGLLIMDTWMTGGSTALHTLVLATAGICLAFGIHAWRGRRWRQKNETTFNQSMLGIIEQSLGHINYYIRHARTVLWCITLPFAFMAIARLTFFSSTNTPWLWGGAVVLCFCSVWETLRDIRDRLLPEKKELNYLRDRLLEKDHQ